jgi:hypothetical protein
MAELLRPKPGALLRLFTPKDVGLDVCVMHTDDEYRKLVVFTILRGGGSITLTWTGEDYHDTSGRIIRVEQPVYVTAVVKRMQTEDGITSLAGVAHIGKAYRMQLNSQEMREWGHHDHPGQRWMRESAVFIDEAGHGGVMPVELFHIQTN